VIGAPVGLAAFLASQVFELFQVQFLYAAGIMLVFSAALFVTISLRTAAPAQETLDEVTWSMRHWRAESEELHGKPAWKNYRVLAGAMTVLTLIVVFLFI
jgi:solute:Na+ symporter, SSS family